MFLATNVLVALSRKYRKCIALRFLSKIRKLFRASFVVGFENSFDVCGHEWN